MVRQVGGFVITRPFAFHCGFNEGSNTAEVVKICPDYSLECARFGHTCDAKCKATSVSLDDFGPKLINPDPYGVGNDHPLHDNYEIVIYHRGVIEVGAKHLLTDDFECSLCSHTTATSVQMTRHVKTKHTDPKLTCEFCKLDF